MQPPPLGGELEGIAHQVVEDLQQQVPVAQDARQLGIGFKGQGDALFIGIEAVGAQDLLNGWGKLQRLKVPLPLRLQPG